VVELLGQIPRDDALITWSTDADLKILEVRVYRMSEVPPHATFECEAGACQRGWCEGRYDLTPECLFLELDQMGFANEAARLQALRQFTQIEGCYWAQRDEGGEADE